MLNFFIGLSISTILKYFIRVGIDVIIYSFVILLYLASTGFTYKSKNGVDSDYLLLVCYDYFYGSRSLQENESIQTFEGEVHSNLQKPDLKSSQGIESSKQDEDVLTFDDIVSSPDSTVSQDSLNIADSTSGELSKKDSLMLGLLEEEKVVLSDSAIRIDSMKADSTMRLKYFKHDRNDKAYTDFSPKKKSSFFVYPSSGKKSRRVELDSSGQFVTISELIAGNAYRPILRMPLSEYIALKIKYGNRELWEKKGREYELKSGKLELSDLMSDITNIDIPLPSSSFLSIFGPPQINIRISGAVDIHGAWRSETTEGVTASALGNTRNEPDFKQQVQINVNGTIGDKLAIKADWNTERDFDYENQLSLKYTGYDDEIIQSIEAGNVSMQTTPLIGGSEALFGIKANLQFGPLKLTALASQKKSEVEEMSVSGGSQKSKFEIRAYDYSENHYFLDSVYYDTTVDETYPDSTFNFFERKYGNSTFTTNAKSRYFYIKDLEVWKSYTGYYNENVRKANAYLELREKPSTADSSFYDDLRSTEVNAVPGKSSIDQSFLKLVEGMDYTFDPQAGFISFTTPVQDQDEIAVAYRIEGPSDIDYYYGDFLQTAPQDSNTVLVLKLVKPKNLIPQWKSAWKLRLKNIYPIGGRDIKQEDFKLEIKFEQEGANPVTELGGVKLLEAFKLDQYNSSGQKSADGEFDFNGDRTIFTSTGEIIFPVLEPFGKDFPEGLNASMRYDSIYTQTKTIAKETRDKDKFIVTGEYSAGISSVFNIGFGMVENSVRVKLAGNDLEEGKDFIVDYNIGQVTILYDQALIPGADLKISYEKNDLFSLASKTMLGLRGIYEFSDDTKFGFTYMNLNQQTLSDKVRIGEEPLDNSIMGVDFQTKQEIPIITKALDKVISTSAPSVFEFQGEYAYMSPDPNTKKSTIAADEGKSIAYVDDFEGSKKIIPIGVGYGTWTEASAPNNNYPYADGLTKLQLMDYKAKSFWFNRIPSDVDVKHIYGDRKQTNRDGNQITVLNYVFYPHERGSYNYGPHDNFVEEQYKNWGGIMKGLSSTASNLTEENIEYIEFWFKNGDGPNNMNTDYNQEFYKNSATDAVLRIDLGSISEDVIPNRDLDTEDKNGNDLIDEGEDVGIDRMTDAEEKAYVAKYYSSSDVVNEDDPSLDNFVAPVRSPSDAGYYNANGTQGNSISTDLGRIPDTEDLNRNKSLDRVDSYFSYEIPVDTNKILNPFIVGGGDNGWFLFRIPLKDYVREVGKPSFENVEFIRLWVAGIDHPLHIRLSEFNLVGSQWKKVITNNMSEDDSVLAISTIGLEENPEYYSPPGVFQETDHTNPDDQYLKNEQSLLMEIRDLEDGDKREIVKYLYQPLDLFNYKEMKMFVHGDKDSIGNSISYYNSLNDYGTEIYFRFGTDTLNYYELRQPLRADWRNMNVVFEDLTAIKDSRDADSSLSRKDYYQKPVAGKAGHYYGIRGQPALTKVTFLMIGILNPKSKTDQVIDTRSLSGDIWINELRVINANDASGDAWSASTSISFADLMSVKFNMSQTDPNFHKLNERFGSRVDNTKWGLSANFDLIKIIPFNLTGSSFKISYSRTESIAKPQYMPGTDISVEASANQKKQQILDNGGTEEEAEKARRDLISDTYTMNTSQSYGISNLNIKIPTDLWYIRDIIGGFSFGYNYNESFNRTPTIENAKKWRWDANGKYNVTFSRDNFIQPSNWPVVGFLFKILKDYDKAKIYFTPQTFNLSATAKRSYSFSRSRGDNIKPNINQDFLTTRGGGFNWKLTDGGLLNLSFSYKFDIDASLAYLLSEKTEDEDADIVYRSEKEVWNDIFGGAGFGEDYRLNQTFDLKIIPMLPTLFDLNRFLTITAGYSSTYNWQRDFSANDLGRSASVKNSFNSSITVKLKSMFDPLFAGLEVDDKPGGSKVIKPGSNRKPRTQDKPKIIKDNSGRSSSGRSSGGRSQSRGNNEVNLDEEIAKGEMDNNLDVDSLDADIEEVDTGPSIITKSASFLALSLKWILFDYEQIRINFSNSTGFGGSGLGVEGTGFKNFWGASQIASNGPSRSFQLGLSHDIGPRAKNGQLSNNFAEKSNIELRTSRPLWDGAKLDIDWKTSWGMNETVQFRTDENGDIVINSPNVTSTRSIDRSFFTLAGFPISLDDAGVENVYNIFQGNTVIDDQTEEAETNITNKLSRAFVKGMESFPVLSKIPILSEFTQYIPRPNWSLSWSGLEKLPLIKSIAKRASLNHAYSSSYYEGWKVNTDGVEEIQSQKITSGFNPLIGLNLTFDKLWGGDLSGSIKYSTKTNYDLGVTTRNITESQTGDISFTASYKLKGFEMPLFGVNLKNDIEFSLSYSRGSSKIKTYDMDAAELTGIDKDGNTRTSMEPRIKYVMSSKVTLSIFYKRSSVTSDGASRIPETTTNEAGLDVRIAIGN